MFIEVLQVFPYVFGCSYVGHIHVYNVYLLMDSSMSIVKCPSGSLLMAFVLKSILSDTSIPTPAFFPCPFAWNIFFPTLHFKSV